LRNIEPTGLVEAYAGKLRRDHNREPMLLPDDAGFDAAGKPPSINLISGHTLPEDVFEHQITLAKALMLAKLPKRSMLQFWRGSFHTELNRQLKYQLTRK
jgi:hypothetical protein